MKNLNEKDKAYIKEMLIILCVGIVVNALCFMLYYLPSHAESNQTYLNFPMGQNDNSFPMQEIISTANNTYNMNLDDFQYKLACMNQFQGFYSGFICLSNDFLYGEILTDGIQFNIYALSQGWKCYEVQVAFDMSWAYVWDRNYLPSLQQSSIYDLNYSYVSNYQVWTTNNPSTAELVLNYVSTPPWVTSEPNPFETLPPDTPNTPPTPPIWDNNLSVGENIGELIKWLGNVVTYLFNNLKDNLRNLFDTIKKTIENAITTFYNNMQSLFKPYIDKVTETIDYISQPLDSGKIIDGISQTQIFSDFTSVNNSVTAFVGFFGNTSEPETFVFPVHLENIPILQTDTQYIDLGIINPVKSTIRALIGALVTFSLVLTIFDAIPNYINGGGDE